LIILDNIENFSILNPFWSDFQHGTVLLTGRDSFPSLSAVSILSGSERLTPFTAAEGTELISKRLRGKIPGTVDDADAAQLAKRFGYLPLFIEHMTSLIEMSEVSLSKFFEEHPENSDRDLQDLALDCPWYTSSIAKAIEAHLNKLDCNTKFVLDIMAFFDPDEIPERLVTSGAAVAESLNSKVQYHLAHLLKSSFLGKFEEQKNQEVCFNIHRLVRDAALRSSSNLQAAFDNAVLLLRRSFPLQKFSRDHMVEDWIECEVFQAHVLSLHHNYTELRKKASLKASFEYIELVYSCSWYVQAYDWR
jgi:hypothetical protein